MLGAGAAPQAPVAGSATIPGGHSATREELLAHLSDQVAKWWLPDDVVFVGELPHTATGKVLKLKLREQYRDHRLPD